MPSSDVGAEAHDVVIVGTGFASSFFLLGYLERASPDARIIVLERGRRNDHAWQIEHRANSDVVAADLFQRRGDPDKNWNFTIGFGGGSNCWWGNTPRMLPADFELQSRFGIGTDWPLSYDDLAPHYERVEREMEIAGPADSSPFPRRGPYPQPPHRLNEAERLLKRAYPGQFFATPTARARLPARSRGTCCANGVCNLCPVDAKFTIQNSLAHLYEDPRVTLLLGAEALAVETAAGRATGVVCRHQDRETTVLGDLVVLGANALFNPAILLRSGLHHPLLGRRLHEQVGLLAEVHLDGVDGFQGSSSVTGHGYMLYDDDTRRRTKAACLIETWNVGTFRPNYGRWLQALPLRLVFEDLPQDRNRVELSPDPPGRPVATFEERSEYAMRAVRDIGPDLERVLAPLPVERVVIEAAPEPTESHVQGTTVMGDHPDSSVIDRFCIHHGIRNLVVLGAGAFPTGSPANPTLTLCALSLWSVDHLLSSAA